MNTNEQKMKLKGEAKVWASITNSSGKAKDVSSTQIGQQLLCATYHTKEQTVRLFLLKVKYMGEFQKKY